MWSPWMFERTMVRAQAQKECESSPGRSTISNILSDRGMLPGAYYSDVPCIVGIGHSARR
jgi:hypothetical protein